MTFLTDLAAYMDGIMGALVAVGITVIVVAAGLAAFHVATDVYRAGLRR